MAFPYTESVFDLLGGQNSLDNPADILQVPRQPRLGTLDPSIPIRFAQAFDVWSPNDRGDIATRPGFDEVRATAINAAGIGTGLGHQGEIADRFLMTVSIVAGSHSVYEDDANPPTEISGGTNPGINQDNLSTLLNFTDGTNPGTIIVFRDRDLAQFINAAGSRSNFTIAGTGLTSLKPGIAEVFGQRIIYADYDQDGTVHDDRIAWTDIRDGNLITDITSQFESFERRTSDKVRGIRRISDFCIIGSRDYLSFLALTPTAAAPFAVQDVPIGAGEGPLSHQGMIQAGGQRVAWMAQSGIYSLEGAQGEVTKEWTSNIRPFIEAMSESRREFTVAEFDTVSQIGVWAVSESGQSKHNKVIAVNFSNGEVYIWTLSRNAFARRIISGEQRIQGMGYVGKLYNEIQTSILIGNADDATAAIDADIITPRHHLGNPTQKKLFFGIR
ncbi:hypothetical protein LCGC14_2161180, partial [marine sediment metagenome]